MEAGWRFSGVPARRDGNVKDSHGHIRRSRRRPARNEPSHRLQTARLSDSSRRCSTSGRVRDRIGRIRAPRRNAGLRCLLQSRPTSTALGGPSPLDGFKDVCGDHTRHSPIVLANDCGLREAAPPEDLRGRFDHLGVAAEVGNRVFRIQGELVADAVQDRLCPAGGAGPVRVGGIGRARDGGHVRKAAGGRPCLEPVAVGQLGDVRDAVHDDDPRPGCRPVSGSGLGGAGVGARAQERLRHGDERRETRTG